MVPASPLPGTPGPPTRHCLGSLGLIAESTHGEARGSGFREAAGPGVGDDLAHGLEEAAHALGNTGGEAGRQAESKTDSPRAV